MARSLLSLLLLATTAMATQVAPPRALTGPSPAAAPDSATFNKEVLPILQTHCQVCHRPGEVGPMSFLTYESARPLGQGDQASGRYEKMPPWFADPGYGSFRNDPTLTAQEIAILSAWADSGAAEGDSADKPKAVQWTSGWRTTPDVVISIPEAHSVPAKGAGEIKAFLVSNPFQQDTWVRSIEIRPGNPSVVHHVIMQVPEDAPTAGQYYWGADLSAPCVAANAISPQSDFTEGLPGTIANKLNGTPGPTPAKAPKNFAILEAVYAPGAPPMDFGLYDSAKLIKGGGQLRIEVHYTPNGTATTDQTRVGFVVAKEPPQYRFLTLAPKSLANVKQPIPAGASNWETRGELDFGQDAQLVWLMPHMHLRGKDMKFTLLSPNGSSNTVLDAKFNFGWQLGYEMQNPIRVRKGTRMVVVAHHDNSANNKYNPDPSVDVAWGDLTSQEMVLPWFGVVVNKDADPENILAIRRSGCNSLPFAILPTSIQSTIPTGNPVTTPAPVRVPGVNPPSAPPIQVPVIPIPKK